MVRTSKQNWLRRAAGAALPGKRRQLKVVALLGAAAFQARLMAV